MADQPSVTPPSSHQELVESVAIGNIKSIAEQPAMLANLAYGMLVTNTNLSQQNAVSNQQAMNQLGISITGASVSLLESKET